MHEISGDMESVQANVSEPQNAGELTGNENPSDGVWGHAHLAHDSRRECNGEPFDKADSVVPSSTRWQLLTGAKWELVTIAAMSVHNIALRNAGKGATRAYESCSLEQARHAQASVDWLGALAMPRSLSRCRE